MTPADATYTRARGLPRRPIRQRMADAAFAHDGGSLSAELERQTGRGQLPSPGGCERQTRNGMIRSATMLAILIMGLMAGPAVSL